ncbi:oogenesis-related protein sosie isoform X1 [Rhodnius prolixus]|uniref:oogenesis-related protein sosie isoform X1 n=1 Tax=Rhodnius prolixus TaxID=13249 RepID=UPI003D18AEAD
MSRTILLLLVISVCSFIGCIAEPDIIQHSRAKRLTAFSKPASPSQTPIVGKGKECKSDRECEVIPYTTCTIDVRDQRRRCICKDGTPPSNGQCQNRPRERRGYLPPGYRRPEKGLREACRSEAECQEGAECKINPNATKSADKRQTVCLCREGTIEIANQCNGSEKSREDVNMALLGLVALITVVRRT